jgi:methylthioribose-1-phosphate isomerase
MTQPDRVQAVRWGGDRIILLDQTLLPSEERYVEAVDVKELARAIRRLAVRGAPLLGIAAGYGIALAAATSTEGDRSALLRELRHAGDRLVASRPTAVNIAWAVERVLGAVTEAPDAGGVRRAALAEATRIESEDAAACLAIGRFGAELVPRGANVLTLCNTGALATGGIGTAQGIIDTAHRQGKDLHVWVSETRPLLQGARLTAWELQRLGVPATVVTDSATATLMAGGSVDLVVVGADRIAANGDVANKVGTYALAIVASHHGVPFYVAAPASTVDESTHHGGAIPIERRNPEEVTQSRGLSIAPAGVWAINPAFDVTPADLITGIVTDRGVVTPPYPAGLRRILRDADRPWSADEKVAP